MTNLEKVKKLIPTDHGYTDDELNSLLADNNNNIYKTAAFVLRGIVAQIVSGAYSFSTGDVRIDKSRLVDNYRTLIEEYESKATIGADPSSVDELWKTEMDRLSGLDITDYADVESDY